jgi:NTP pyrophosphatase (non-canonical NTP hydrolase)
MPNKVRSVKRLNIKGDEIIIATVSKDETLPKTHLAEHVEKAFEQVFKFMGYTTWVIMRDEDAKFKIVSSDEEVLTFEELRIKNVERCEQVFHRLIDWSIEDWTLAFIGEAGEACNAVKKLKRYYEGTNTKRDPATEDECIENIGKELADTIIYADLLAARLGIDLEEVIRRKFNVVSDRMKSDIKL